MSYISSKTGWSTKDGLEGDLERLCTHKVQPANSRESLLAHFDISTFDMFMRGGRAWVVSGLRYLKRRLQALPFSPSTVFRLLAFLLLEHFFHTDWEPGTGYNWFFKEAWWGFSGSIPAKFVQLQTNKFQELFKDFSRTNYSFQGIRFI